MKVFTCTTSNFKKTLDEITISEWKQYKNMDVKYFLSKLWMNVEICTIPIIFYIASWHFMKYEKKCPNLHPTCASF